MNTPCADLDNDWSVTISLGPRDGQVCARASMPWRGRDVVGVGLATSDELAVSRALSDLARRTMTVSVHDNIAASG
ncbi:dsRBD fold-containing protein [Mycolicibacterium stellerae]|uniref:dsRBD fold-containing protein n=1 Tax=Mycolicibacterium stellerae TaxID=2358193 RepID=UPI000F0AF964|nr:dsRBD fold-containing protein [Mycolicibacterium stellerae]